jgi:mRNA-degrading endonuclease RelE of RelBE toxin-antitoxin system
VTLRWTIRVTPHLATRIAEFPPERKRRVRDTLRHLETSPNHGKTLQRELSGYRSVTVKPLRIIYHLAERTVHLDAIGLRAEVYERFAEALRLARGAGGASRPT